MGGGLQQEREGPWALALAERVPEAFGVPPCGWPEGYSEGGQPGDSRVFLHGVVFLVGRRGGVARSTGTFLRRASEVNE